MYMLVSCDTVTFAVSEISHDVKTDWNKSVSVLLLGMLCNIILHVWKNQDLLSASYYIVCYDCKIFLFL